MPATDLPTRAAEAAAPVLAHLSGRADLPPGLADDLRARLDVVLLDLVAALEQVYGEDRDVAQLLGHLVDLAVDAAADRPDDLRRLDRRREIDPAWFQRARMVGYVCYADRFAGTLAGVRDRLDYLTELGVTYLHLMPLLRAREGENDGGYAVADYTEVDPRLGSMDDLEALATDLRGRGMSLCIDLVVNHTAREHAWARAAMAGDEHYRRFYRVFPDRSEPDEYERTLWEVFPDTAPGSFTHVPEMGGWVWTTFHEYQWDLDWSNPDVFAAMLETILELANRGVDVFRLDAVPFLWKRMGTDSQNQPEAHALLQALHALVRVAAPAVIFKAEAIVAPDDLVPYLGAHDRYVPECELAYNNQLMVMLWSTLATRDVRLMAHALRRMRREPRETSWVTYVRCHDDIGWAVSDADASAQGLDPRAHRRFLVDFYAGRHPGSFALGEPFQENPVTGDARTSGSAASLTGIERGLRDGDDAEVATGLRRLVLLYSVVYSYGGIPLLYMGDELALRNDPSYRDDPGLAEDNRWMHRPRMDWSVAERRHEPGTIEAQAFGWLARLARARSGQLALRGGGETDVLDTGNDKVFGYRRRHPRSLPLVALANVDDFEQSLGAGVLVGAGLPEARVVLASDDGIDVVDGRVTLPPYGFVWFAPPEDGDPQG